MQNLAKLKFSTFALQAPTDWKQPQGDPDAQQFTDAFQASERAVPPDTMAPPLFIPPTPNKYHVDTQKQLNAKFGAFIDGICSAICSAWSTWQSTAMLTGVMVNAVTAAGGVVAGPPLLPLILASAPKATPSEIKYSMAVANAIGTGWLSYTASIKVPGLPWYPAFAAVPSPVAPPVPNTPVPVIALVQVTASVGAAMLKTQMSANLGDPMAPFHKELFESIADAFEKCFLIWQASTQVTQVMGFGAVPTFAPPIVPVGPVVAGMANMIPGGFK
jgi:hypothetical protein